MTQGPQGSAQSRLFLRRMNHLKETLDHEVEAIKISRNKANDHVPRAGKSILEEERSMR